MKFVYRCLEAHYGSVLMHLYRGIYLLQDMFRFRGHAFVQNMSPFQPHQLAATEVSNKSTKLTCLAVTVDSILILRSRWHSSAFTTSASYSRSRSIVFVGILLIKEELQVNDYDHHLPEYLGHAFEG